MDRVRPRRGVDGVATTVAVGPVGLSSPAGVAVVIAGAPEAGDSRSSGGSGWGVGSGSATVLGVGGSAELPASEAAFAAVRRRRGRLGGFGVSGAGSWSAPG